MGLAAQVLWSSTVTCVKIAILLLYCKIFTLSWFIWSARFVGFLCICYTLGTILAAFLVCQPLPYYWDTAIQGHCGNEFLSYILTGSINIATDVMVLVLPIPSLVRLEMTLYKKLILIGTFACGLFTCIIGALRLRSIVMVDFNDYTYSIADAMTYSTLEPALAIVLACIPTLRPLLPARTSQANSSASATKWRFHPSLITYGGSRDPGSGNDLGKKDAIRLDDPTESECELTVRPTGTMYHAEARSPRYGRQRSEETILGKDRIGDRQDGRDVETGVWVEHDWRVESRDDRPGAQGV